MVTFHVEINKGPEQIFKVKTGQYKLAAMAALAILDYIDAENGEDIIKIWVPELMPEYGPYFYAYDGYNVGTPSKDERW